MKCIRNMFVIMLAVTFSQVAIAQDDQGAGDAAATAEPTEAVGTEPEASEPETSTDSSSRGNRAGKVAWVAAEAIGLTIFPVQGLRGGYFVSRDLSVGASYATGSATLLDFEFTKTVIEAGAKYFIGNSFYVDGNLAMETFTFKSEIDGTTAGTKVDFGGSVTSTGVSLHIGNQWQWGGFTLGCDWLGYFASFSDNVSFDSVDGVDDAKKEKEEKDVEDSFSGGSPHITRLYLGWAF